MKRTAALFSLLLVLAATDASAIQIYYADIIDDCQPTQEQVIDRMSDAYRAQERPWYELLWAWVTGEI